MFKDIVFSLPFLHCYPSSLSFQISLCRAWTPATQQHRDIRVKTAVVMKIKHLRMETCFNWKGFFNQVEECATVVRGDKVS